MLFFTAQRFFREPVVTCTNSHHRAALPLGELEGFLLRLLEELLLHRDGLGDALFRLDELVCHLDDHLVQHFLRVFGPADHVVEVAFDDV